MFTLIFLCFDFWHVTEKQTLKADHEKHVTMRQKKKKVSSYKSSAVLLRTQGVLVLRLKAYFIKRLSNTTAM